MNLYFTFLVSTLVLNQAQSRPSPETPPSPCLPLGLTPIDNEVELKKQNITIPSNGELEHVFVSNASLQLVKQILGETTTMVGQHLCTVDGSSSPLRDGEGRGVKNARYKEPDTVGAGPMEGASLLLSADTIMPLIFLFSADHVRTLVLLKTVRLQVSCPSATEQCFDVTIKGYSSHHGEKLFRRSAVIGPVQELSQSHDLAQESHDHSVVRDILLPVVVSAVGVLLLVLVLALCADNSSVATYDPAQAKKSPNRTFAADEVAEAEQVDSGLVATPDHTSSPTITSTPVVKEVKTNGTTTAGEGSDEVFRKPATAAAADRLSPASLELSERERSHSTRSNDPLPEVPKLELAEDNRDRSSREKSKEREGDGDDNDDDDDDPYAEVPGENEERMAESDSDDEGGGGGAGGGDDDPAVNQASPSPLPPYGKISRHAKPPRDSTSEAIDDSDSYAEVRDVIRRAPPHHLMAAAAAKRERSHTDPPVPGEAAGASGLRDKRTLTESATNMPLPAIPKGGGGMSRSSVATSATIDENEMYDSIPEKEERRVSETRRREKLYESVDEIGGDKDLYESVPDTLTSKPPEPQPPPPPLGSPTKASKVADSGPPSLTQSPIPTKKKNSEKNLAAMPAPSEEGKRRFSFFNRKKTPSVSKKVEQQQQQQQQQQQVESPTATTMPLALTSTASPIHKSPPPLPNIPVPPCPNGDLEDEEDNYDRVSPSMASPGLSNVPQSGVVGEDVKSKSMSLPMTYRTGGGGGGLAMGGGSRPNLPLPRVPEDSGSAIVVHKRVLETNHECPDDYDTVHISPAHTYQPDDPNYDTVKVEDIAIIESDPPYDKIDKQELERERERQRLLSEEGGEDGAEDVEDPYAKVRDDDDDAEDPEGKYDKIRSGETEAGNAADENDKSIERDVGPSPDHDEGDYAVVPEEVKMRKRALSQGQKARDKQLSPTSEAAGYHVIGEDIRENRSQTVSASPQKLSSPGAAAASASASEDQYAIVDYMAKRDKKQRELEEVLREQEALRAYTEEDAAPDKKRSVSPMPPPLPPALAAEDIDEELRQPPVPMQSAGVHELVSDGPPRMHLQPDTGSGGSGSDPPYAKVRSKVDNPYAEVNRPYAEVDINQLVQNKAAASSAPPLSNSNQQALENMMDEAAGYDVVGTIGVKTKIAQRKDKPYDTVADVMTNSDTDREPPKPAENTEEDEASATANANIYDSLLPETKKPQHFSDSDDDDEDPRYETVDSSKTPRSMV